jgi:SAM-dependent methyltransferase
VIAMLEAATEAPATAPAEATWRPTPKFLLRLACIREVTAEWPPGRFVEAGAGTGTLTRTFLDRGFTGTCYDITPETRDIIRRNVADKADVVDVPERADDIAPGAYDYLFAFEVLEHIEDDLGALRLWTRWLRQYGRVLVSVPAHQRKYGPVDLNVGHVRRYERAGLESLLASAGYVDIEVRNYGFPLGNVLRISQNLANRVLRRGASDKRSFVERSVDSGVKTSKGGLWIAPLVSERTLAPFAAVQRRVYRRELGDGFVATARKV